MTCQVIQQGIVLRSDEPPQAVSRTHCQPTLHCDADVPGVDSATMHRLGLVVVSLALSRLILGAADIVTFPGGALTLHGVVYKPDGAGPFPVLLYNHGSARAC
jgi:hypothetical protein